MQPVAAFVHERRHGSRRRGDDEVDPRRRGRRGRVLRRRHRASPRRSWAIPSPPTSSCWAMPGRRAWCRCRSRRIERAIELNGVAVETSKRTFAWGRLAAHDLAAVQAAAKPTLRVEKPVARTLPEIVAKRVELLTAYQDKAYAERYRAFVDKVARAEKDKAPGRRGLAEAVAKSLYKLMAYKDEYEVGASLQRRRVPEEARRAVRGRLQAHLPPRAAAVRRSRSRDRPAQEARIRRLDDAAVPLARRRSSDCAARGSTSSATPRSAAWSAG